MFCGGSELLSLGLYFAVSKSDTLFPEGNIDLGITFKLYARFQVSLPTY